MGEGIFLEVIMIKTEDLIKEIRLESDLSSEGDHLYRNNDDVLRIINRNLTTIQSKLIQFDRSYFLEIENFPVVNNRMTIPENSYNRSINRIEFNSNNTSASYYWCELQRIHNIDEYYYDYQPSFLIRDNEVQFYGIGDVNEVRVYYYRELLPLVLEANAPMIEDVFEDSNVFPVSNYRNFTVGKRIFIQDDLSNRVYNKVITEIRPVMNEDRGSVVFEGNISLSVNSRYSNTGINRTNLTRLMDKGLLYYTIDDMNLSKEKQVQTRKNINDWMDQLRDSTRNVSNVKGIGIAY